MHDQLDIHGILNSVITFIAIINIPKSYTDKLELFLI